MTTTKELRQELTLLKTNILNFETKLDMYEDETEKTIFKAMIQAFEVVIEED